MAGGGNVQADDGNTFMTSVKQQEAEGAFTAGISADEHANPASKDGPLQSRYGQTAGPQTNELSAIYGGETTAQTSYFDSKLLASRREKADAKRAVTRSPVSRYRNI